MNALSQLDFDSLIAAAKIIESDRRGVKVYETDAGEMVKLFRIKRFFSSNLTCPFAVRFAHNASRLHDLGIPALRVSRIAKVPHLARQMVVYDKLPGISLRDRLRKSDCREMMRQTGRFIAMVQNRGVYFRSFHFGNILTLKDERFALIDVLDMRFLSRSLGVGRRLRNFRHMLRHAEDRQSLTTGWQEFTEGYAVAMVEGQSALSEAVVEKLLATFRHELEQSSAQ